MRSTKWFEQHFLVLHCLLTAVTIQAKAGATELDFQQLCPWDRRGVGRTLPTAQLTWTSYHIPEFTMAENPGRLRCNMGSNFPVSNWAEVLSMPATSPPFLTVQKWTKLAANSTLMCFKIFAGIPTPRQTNRAEHAAMNICPISK